MSFIILACNPTKRLAEGQYLLDKNVLTADNIDISKEQLNEIVKQRPNKRILPFTRFHLHMYNLPDPDKMEEKRAEKDARRAERNERRVAKGKDPVGPGRTFGEWLREVVGEPPTILDTALVRKGHEQLKTYLVKKGYFQNTVKDSVSYRPKSQLATVYYHLSAEPPYVVDSVHYKLDDPSYEKFVMGSGPNQFLNPGVQFDVDQLSKERERLSDVMRNSGYFGFSKEYIYFEVDSTRGDRKVNLTYHVDNLKVPYSSQSDSLVSVPHKRYKFDQIFFKYKFGTDENARDTIVEEGYHFLNSTLFPMRNKVLIQNTFLYPNAYYQEQNVERTYRRLAALNVISHVNFRFEPDELKPNMIDVFITLVPARRQNLSFETKGTNSGGFLGIEGDLVYRHKNIFRGAEVMELKLNGGVQAQSLLTDNSGSEQDVSGENNVDLNTLEIGPSISFTFPKFLIPVNSNRFSRSINPSTVINAGYSYQSRPDYTRSLVNTFIGYAWNESSKKRHQINPVELSIIRIDKSDEFQARLDDLNDQFLSDSYQNHVITSTSYSFTFNDHERLSKKNALYYRGGLELSGNILRGLYNLTNAPKDETGSYQVLGTRFSNFVKTTNDFRFYRNFSDRSSMAFRFAGGIGVPLANLSVLPFSKSFFSGGANGLRAWRARTVGPGGFFEPEVTYDKIGDVQIESNVEYRFNLIDYIEGAFFIDAGNIWLLNEDELRPNGHFRPEEFISEIAVGAGFGFRLDFDYFLIRFDLASQLKDPALVKGERWVFQDKDQYNTAIEEYNLTLGPAETPVSNYQPRFNFNLGIGYPF